MSESMTVRLWHEGRRVLEVEAISMEYDGETVEVLTEDGEDVTESTEWDELTVTT